MEIKRSFMKVLILSLVLALAACSGGGNGKQSQPSADPQETAAGDPPVTLTFWMFSTNGPFYDVVDAEFKKRYPNVTIDRNVMEIGTLADKYAILRRSGGQGAPDLVEVESGVFPRFIRGEIPFVALDEYMAADQLENAIAEGRRALYSVDGKQYAIDHASAVSALYYRKDLFDEAGIDVTKLKTWDEFAEAVKPLTGNGKFIFPAGEFWNSTGSEQTMFELLLRQEGGDVVLPDGGVGVNTPEALAALKRIKDWKDQGIMDTAYPDALVWGEKFLKGEYLATFGPDWWLDLLATNLGDLNGKMAAAPMPLGGPNSVPTTVWGGTGIAISSFSKQQDLAWEYIKLAQLSKEMAVKRFQTVNLFPPLLEALDDPGLHEATKHTEFLGGQDIGALYGDLAKVAPRQNVAWWRPLFTEAWDKYRFDYAKGELTPEQFLDKVAQELRDSINKQPTS